MRIEGPGGLPPTGGGQKLFQINDGESLNAVALKLKISPEQIASKNDLKLLPNQELNVPGLSQGILGGADVLESLGSQQESIFSTPDQWHRSGPSLPDGSIFSTPDQWHRSGPSMPDGSNYLTQMGDTVKSVALQLGVSLEDLLGSNNLLLAKQEIQTG